MRLSSKELQASGIIQEILQENKAGFNDWTRSVACYMIPRLQAERFPVHVLKRNADQEGPLFQETREYVLSMLN